MKIYDVKKSFEKFSLHIESLDMPEGKIYGLIGPNGCGKTTAMKLMAGVMQPDSGYIDHEGLNPREITMIFRKPYLLHDTVLRNLLYPLKLRKLQPDMEQINHLLDIADLHDRRDEYALSLSGGEQQKLSLIRALIFSPKLIFIDEGFANMDIESVAFFENYILGMHASQHEPLKKNPLLSPATWVIISHQLSNIRRLCEHVLFMHDGKIKASGPTERMLSMPEDADLKRYLRHV
jgi:ABC-type multidrug transport system ATPase subunit